ncbi:ribbon-helix-helix domain-containing protein [Mesorhizobium sp. ZMM04-5]|uniref:Ribbon-helix-helix domain-containing protein n=1 Tax=Mesorhizobium marinum TaxID=3228790 RepID=A0ABV3R5B3_9HYPH
MTSGPAGDPPPLTPDDVEAEFRVVVRDGNRRGVRMERFFWSLLKRLAESRRTTVGQLVEDISNAVPDAGNLTSAIRVACSRALADENAKYTEVASLKTVSTLLTACPSPAFALSSSKKILAFNPSFQSLVRRQLPMAQAEDDRQGLRLALDLNVSEIFARLESDRERPVVTGFVIGMADRRYRAQLSIVRAPLVDSDVLLAFVFG